MCCVINIPLVHIVSYHGAIVDMSCHSSRGLQRFVWHVIGHLAEVGGFLAR